MSDPFRAGRGSQSLTVPQKEDNMITSSAESSGDGPGLKLWRWFRMPLFKLLEGVRWEEGEQGTKYGKNDGGLLERRMASIWTLMSWRRAKPHLFATFAVVASHARVRLVADTISRVRLQVGSALIVTSGWNTARMPKPSRCSAY
jgi:hypothetical protein